LRHWSTSRLIRDSLYRHTAAQSGRSP
jgi:hypothetical protein